MERTDVTVDPHFTHTRVLRTPACYEHPRVADIRVLRTPACYGHPRVADIRVLRTSACCGHPRVTNTCVLRTPACYGHPRVTDTRVLQTLYTDTSLQVFDFLLIVLAEKSHVACSAVIILEWNTR